MEFATVINCMDGRVQLPVIEFMRKQYGKEYIDMITEAGPNKLLAENKNLAVIESIKERVDISVYKHKSEIIAVVGHYDCAGNPTTEEEQKNQIQEAINLIKTWNYNLQVIGLWVNHEWKVEALDF